MIRPSSCPRGTVSLSIFRRALLPSAVEVLLALSIACVGAFAACGEDCPPIRIPDRVLTYSHGGPIFIPAIGLPVRYNVDQIEFREGGQLVVITATDPEGNVWAVRMRRG